MGRGVKLSGPDYFVQTIGIKLRRIIDRYLAVNFIMPFVSATAFFVTFLLTFQLFRITRIVINKGVPWMDVLELTGHIALSFVPMAVPIAALFAAIYCYNKLSDDSEIIAIRSFGIGRFTLLKPALMIGVIISLTVFALNRNLIPYSKRVFQNTIVKLTSSGVLNSIKSGQFFTEIPNATLFAEYVAEDGVTMRNVFIQTATEGRVEERKDEQIIVAKQGRLIKQGKSDVGFNNIRLHLKDGNIFKLANAGIEQQKIIFKEYDFPIMTEQNRFESVNKFSMRTSDELVKIINDYQKEKKELLLIKNNQALDENQQNSFNEISGSLPKVQLEYFSRWNAALQCLIFIFLGVSLGIKHNRGKARNSAAYSLLILILYYVILFTGISMTTRSGVLHPAVAIFMPSGLAILAGVYFYRKIQWPA